MSSSQKPPQPKGCGRYSVVSGAERALEELIRRIGNKVPLDFVQYKSQEVTFFSPSENDKVFFPCPLKEQDAIAAIKALEALTAATIANLRWNNGEKVNRKIAVDLDKSACFLMSAYLTTLDNKGKAHPDVKEMINKTDLNNAQTILFRRLSANLYRTKDGKYYHIHGSLDPDSLLRALGLDPQLDLQEYGLCKRKIGSAVAKFTLAELENMNRQVKGAGIEAITWKEFQDSKHGKVLCTEPPFSLERHPSAAGDEPASDAFSFAEFGGQAKQPPGRLLGGVKVLEMCRIIAGPTIGRSLAAHGALVTKVTSPKLPDVPFFQADVNTGKHTVDLDLKGNAEHRRIFEDLLREADVLIDGYRYGALDDLGYGVKKLEEIAEERGFGFVYVAEDCFGGTGNSDAEWAGRRGWQQIADCATGVAWAQGEFMHPRKPEPVIPPFPMSDYGTGALGCLAALAGLYQRATQGGTWVCRTSLCQYDVFLMGLGLLPPQEQAELRREHKGTGDSDFFGLRYDDSVDEVGKRALVSLGATAGHLLQGDLMCEARSNHFGKTGGENGKRVGAKVRWPKEAIAVSDLIIGHVRPARNNGDDKPTWDQDKWEVDEKLADSIGLPRTHPEYVLASA
ncbi:formyl-CoA:oxalate CoA-transferase [Naviculisporaceae sp. PSN 640]